MFVVIKATGVFFSLSLPSFVDQTIAQAREMFRHGVTETTGGPLSGDSRILTLEGLNYGQASKPDSPAEL